MLRFFVLAFLLGLAAAATDYCKLCPKHVMCLYPGSTPGKACKNYEKPTMSASDKDLIVRLHNEYRNKVALGQEKRGLVPQPSASNMRKMSWDDEVATYAQRWADQCTFEHDTCHTTKDNTISGQNLLQGGLAPKQSKPDWAEAIRLWYDEVTARNGSKNTEKFEVDDTFMNVGHFTQLAWAETYAVGCAYSTYTAGSGTAVDTQLVVCNYKPSGNFIDEIMYEGGAPASKCPNGTAKDSTYPGLCATSAEIGVKVARSVTNLSEAKETKSTQIKVKHRSSKSSKSTSSRKKSSKSNKKHKKSREEKQKKH